MSISLLQNAPWLDIKVNNVVSGGEINAVDIIASNLQVDNMTVSEGFALTNMDNPFPQQGSAGQVLSSNGAGQPLSWIAIGGGGNGISALTTTTPSEIEVSVANNVGTINYIGTGGSGITNITTGTPSDLAITNNNNVVNINYVGQTGQNLIVQGTANEITANTVLDTCTLSLPSTVDIQNLNVQSVTVNNAYQLPNADAPFANYVLSSNGSGSCSWIQNGNNLSIQGTANQITASTVLDVCTLSLPQSIDLQNVTVDTLRINDAYSMPQTLGLENQVLSVGPNASLVWSSGGGSSGVNSITSADNNVVIAGSARNPTIALATSLNFTDTSSNIILNGQNSFTNLGLNQVTENIGVVARNEDGDVYADLSYISNVSPASQDAKLTLFNANSLSTNSKVQISAIDGIMMNNQTDSGQITTINSTGLNIISSNSNPMTECSIESGTILMSDNNSNAVQITSQNITMNANNSNSYTLPTTRGTNGQALCIQNDLTGATSWQTVGGSGGGSVNQVSNTDNNLVVNPTSGNVVVNLAQNLSIAGGSIQMNASNNTNIGCGSLSVRDPISTTGVGLDADLGLSIYTDTSHYTLPMTNPATNNVLKYDGNNVVWAANSGGANYTNTDNNLVINNTTDTINLANTLTFTNAPYLSNTINATSITLNDTQNGQTTTINAGLMSVVQTGSQTNSVAIVPTGIRHNNVVYPISIDTSLSSLTFGFGIPGTFGFASITLYGNIFEKKVVFEFNTASPILIQGTSGTLECPAFIMPSAFQSLLPSGTVQELCRFPLQQWVNGGSTFDYLTTGVLKLYNNGNGQYAFCFGFDGGIYNDQFNSFQNGYYVTFSDLHNFPNDHLVLVGSYI